MTEKEDSAFVERFTVRMPDGMRDAIAERAKKNGRSMNSEIVQILQDALEFNGIGGSSEASIDAKKLHQILDKVIEEALGSKKPT